MLCSISGLCKSIGFEIALMCDARYAEEKAVFGFSNRHLGIPLLNNGPKRLAQLIGLSKATEFLVMDRQIDAREAEDLGIVNAVVQDGTGTFELLLISDSLKFQPNDINPFIEFFSPKFSALGSTIKTAVFLSSLPQSSLQHDLSVLHGSQFDTDKWPSILNDINSNIFLNESSLKSARISKLNNMAEWELDEIEHEKNYAKKYTKTK